MGKGTDKPQASIRYTKGLCSMDHLPAGWFPDRDGRLLHRDQHRGNFLLQIQLLAKGYDLMNHRFVINYSFYAFLKLKL